MDPLLLIIAVALCGILAVWLVTWLGGRLFAPDPQAVLRRCRFNLWCVRRDLAQLPATWAVHDLSNQADREEQNIASMEARGGR